MPKNNEKGYSGRDAIAGGVTHGSLAGRAKEGAFGDKLADPGKHPRRVRRISGEG